MCRLFGYAAPRPISIVEALGLAQAQRFQGMARLHDDGWGTVWVGEESTGVPDRQLHRFRDASTGHQNKTLAEALRRPRALARVMHLRLMTDDMDIELSNTHPFIHGSIALAHNGSIVPTEPFRQMLDAPALERVEGTTDSELYLALLSQEVAAGADVPTALVSTVRRLRVAYPVASLNAMILTSDHLCVVRSSHASPVPWEDFIASGLADHELPLDHSDAYFTMSYRELDDGGWAFASAGLEPQGWLELPENTLATVELDTLTMQLTDVLGAVTAGIS